MTIFNALTKEPLDWKLEPHVWWTWRSLMNNFCFLVSKERKCNDGWVWAILKIRFHRKNEVHWEEVSGSRLRKKLDWMSEALGNWEFLIQRNDKLTWPKQSDLLSQHPWFASLYNRGEKKKKNYWSHQLSVSRWKLHKPNWKRSPVSLVYGSSYSFLIIGVLLSFFFPGMKDLIFDRKKIKRNFASQF